MKPQKLKLIAALVATACSLPAHAVLERVGPTSIAPSIGGFPAWYQDTTGLALEFCDPQNAAELSGGWCRLLPGDVPSLPEVFPANYFPEHFYFNGTAAAVPKTGGKADLVLAQEGGFMGGVPVAGKQIGFARIRVKLTVVPVTGKYRFIHPYGEELLDGVAGDRIFFTNDVGFGCVGDFACALGSRLGPFLLPANAPGGAELPPVTGPVAGKLYIASPTRLGPVTGSTLPNFIDSTGASRNHNIFRVEGPVGSNLGGPGIDYIETTNFSLQGRVFTGAIPGKVNVDRASYARDAAGQQLDVFAGVEPTTQGRIPAQPTPFAVMPQLSFFDAPCAGTIDPVTGAVLPPFSAPLGANETLMFASGTNAWGQSKPLTIPTGVCVKDAAARDAAGNIVPAYYPRQVTDQVTVATAAYDPASGNLNVAAISSDALVPPALTVAVGNTLNPLAAGSASVPVGFAPPDTVRVFSSALGSNDARVVIGAVAGTPAPVGLPTAVNDTFSFLANAGPQALPVLANDANVAGGTVTVTTPPRFGTAVANATGTVTYTPTNACLGVTDSFTYTVAVGTTVSNVGTVTLNVGSVNCPPNAVNDTSAALVNFVRGIDVLANDTDPNGFADIVAPANVTQPLPAGGATTVVSGRLVNFLATVPGTYTFTYQAMDAAGALSNVGTVTVTAAATETVAVTGARFTPRLGRMRVTGTISPVIGQTITAEYVNTAHTVLGLIGSTTPASTGTWTVEKLGVTAIPVGTNGVKVTTSDGTVVFSPLK